MTNDTLIIITNRTCNNRCEHCDPCNYNKQYFPIKKREFKQIIKDFYFVSNIYLFGGEPSLSPLFYDYLGLISDKFIMPGVVTNGWMFERKNSSVNFWKKINNKNIKNIHICLSIDYFHLPFFLKRNKNYQRGHYPFILLNNIKFARDFNIAVELEINWVYSLEKKFCCPKFLYKKILNLLKSLKKDRYIQSFNFVFDPLQKKEGSGMFYKYHNKKSNPWVVFTPNKYPWKFNNCHPYFCALKDNDQNIKYSFCMYLGKNAIFSRTGLPAGGVKKKLNKFTKEHPVIDNIVSLQSNVFNKLRKVDKSKEFLKFLNNKQICYKNNSACSICKYLFNQGLI